MIRVRATLSAPRALLRVYMPKSLQSYSTRRTTPLSHVPTPRSLVAAMSQSVIGHTHAKRALAVALRARARRANIADTDLQRASAPAAAAGLLISGPTGSGKTALVRAAAVAVAAATADIDFHSESSEGGDDHLIPPVPSWLPDLSRAPFVAAEATRFTEVGVVGADLATVVHDLVSDARALVAQALVRRRVRLQCSCGRCTGQELGTKAVAAGAVRQSQYAKAQPAHRHISEEAGDDTDSTSFAASLTSPEPPLFQVSTPDPPFPVPCPRAACAERLEADSAVAGSLVSSAESAASHLLALCAGRVRDALPEDASLLSQSALAAAVAAAAPGSADEKLDLRTIHRDPRGALALLSHTLATVALVQRREEAAANDGSPAGPESLLSAVAAYEAAVLVLARAAADAIVPAPSTAGSAAQVSGEDEAAQHDHLNDPSASSCVNVIETALATGDATLAFPAPASAAANAIPLGAGAGGLDAGKGAAVGSGVASDAVPEREVVRALLLPALGTQAHANSVMGTGTARAARAAATVVVVEDGTEGLAGAVAAECAVTSAAATIAASSPTVAGLAALRSFLAQSAAALSLPPAAPLPAAPLAAAAESEFSGRWEIPSLLPPISLRAGRALLSYAHARPGDVTASIACNEVFAEPVLAASDLDADVAWVCAAAAALPPPVPLLLLPVPASVTSSLPPAPMDPALLGPALAARAKAAASAADPLSALISAAGPGAGQGQGVGAGGSGLGSLFGGGFGVGNISPAVDMIASASMAQSRSGSVLPSPSAAPFSATAAFLTPSASNATVTSSPLSTADAMFRDSFARLGLTPPVASAKPAPSAAPALPTGGSAQAGTPPAAAATAVLAVSQQHLPLHASAVSPAAAAAAPAPMSVAAALARLRHVSAFRVVLSSLDDAQPHALGQGQGPGQKGQGGRGLGMDTLNALAVRAASSLGVVFIDEIDKIARPGSGGTGSGSGGQGSSSSSSIFAGRARQRRAAAAARRQSPSERAEELRLRRAARRRAPSGEGGHGGSRASQGWHDDPVRGGKGEGVQKELLSLIEGTIVPTPAGAVDTTHVLFVAAGAFHVSAPDDLLPELRGRLPQRVLLSPLGPSALARVLVLPTGALLRQHAALLRAEGVALLPTAGGVRALAAAAVSANGRDVTAEIDADAIEAEAEAEEEAAGAALRAGSWALPELQAADTESSTVSTTQASLFKLPKLLYMPRTLGSASSPSASASAVAPFASSPARSQRQRAAGAHEDIGTRRLVTITAAALERLNFEAPALVERAAHEWRSLALARANAAAAAAAGCGEGEGARAIAAAQEARILSAPWPEGITPARPLLPDANLGVQAQQEAQRVAASGPSIGSTANFAGATEGSGMWITVRMDEAFVAREVNPLLEDMDADWDGGEEADAGNLARYLL